MLYVLVGLQRFIIIVSSLVFTAAVETCFISKAEL